MFVIISRFRLWIGSLIFLFSCSHASVAWSDGAGVVVAIDTSGSMKSHFQQAISTASKVIGSLPDRTGVSVVTFADDATELIFVENLSLPQRARMKATLEKLRPTGQYTNYDLAFEQFYETSQRLGGGNFILAFTDGKCDTSEGHDLCDIGQLVETFFPASSGTQVVVVDLELPIGKPERLPANLTFLGPEPDLAARLLDLHRTAIVRHERPYQDRTARTLAVLLTSLLGGTLYLYIRRRQWSPPAKDEQVDRVLFATSQGQEHNLGDPARFNRVYIGADPTCAITVNADDIGRRHALLFWRKGAFYVRNLSHEPIEVCGSKVRWRRRTPLTFPADIRLSEKGTVRLRLERMGGPPTMEEFVRGRIEEMKEESSWEKT